MGIGSSRSSRLKVSIVLLCFGVALLLALPTIDWLANRGIEESSNRYDFLRFWPAVYLISVAIVISMLTAIVAHLIRFDANSTGKFKILGVELPVEMQGASLLWLLLAIAATGATMKWDLVQLTDLFERLENAERDLQTAEAKLAYAEGERDTLKTILSGERHSEGIEVLSLVVACGATSDAKHSNWEIHNSGKEWLPYSGLTSALKVGDTERTYRMAVRELPLIKVAVEFVDHGIVKVDIDKLTNVDEYCRRIKDQDIGSIGPNSLEHQPVLQDLEDARDDNPFGEIESSAKRDG